MATWKDETQTFSQEISEKCPSGDYKTILWELNVAFVRHVCVIKVNNRRPQSQFRVFHMARDSLKPVPYLVTCLSCLLRLVLLST